MINPTSIDELVKGLSNLLPSDLKTLKDDFQKNAAALIQSAFERMNLVSREEFDIQTALLARTQEKLEQLEKQLQELEQQLEIKQND